MRDILTKRNFNQKLEVNSTNVTESNERTNIQTDERKGKNYISIGINDWGIIRTNRMINKILIEDYEKSGIIKTIYQTVL